MQVLEAALALVEVIGDVGGEVGLHAVLAHHHPVLLVAEFGGAEPQRAVLRVHAAVVPRGARARGRSRRCSRARAPNTSSVEVHAELVQVVADLGQHAFQRDPGRARSKAGRAEEPAHARSISASMCVPCRPRAHRAARPAADSAAGRRSAVAVRGQQLSAIGADVVAAIAVAREHERLAVSFQVAQPDADARGCPSAGRHR